MEAKQIFKFILILLVLTLSLESISAARFNLMQSTDLSYGLKHQKFECKERSCPDYLAKVIFYSDVRGNSYSTYNCTGVFIAKDLVLTAAHCLDPERKLNGKKPTDTKLMYVVWAAEHGLKYGRFSQVKQIVEYRYSRGEDLALLKLKDDIDEVDIVELAVNGVNDDETWIRWSLYMGNSFKNKIKKLNCKSNWDVFENDRHESPELYKNIAFENCPAVLGNSGSPFIKNREVGAILAGTHQNSRFPGKSFSKGTFAGNVENLD